MSMTSELAGESRFWRFWRSWRRDIVRGAALFVGVVILGFGVRAMIGRSLESLSAFVPFDGDFDRERSWAETFRWTDRVAPGEQIWIRNTNGEITVEPAAGESLLVVADKGWTHAATEPVKVVGVRHEGGVTFCALWDAREASCEPRGRYRLSGAKHVDVAVRFRVQLPRGVLIDASTVNGSISVDDAAAPVVVRTVNGSVTAVTRQGSVRANTVNGNIDVTIGALSKEGEVALETVNGSITATLPAKLNAELEASTVSGRVETDYPLMVTGRVNPRRVKATIGVGGPRLALKTVNGSVRLVGEGEHVGAVVVDVPVPPEVPEPPAAPAPGRPGRRQ